MNTINIADYLKQNVESYAAKSYKGKLVNKIELVPNTFEITLELEENYDFIPGQYMWVTLKELLHPDVRGSKRAFTLLRPEHNRKKIAFTFRTSDSGFKKTLLSLATGSEVEISGPRGAFTLSEINTPTVLIAGGVGVTPFIEMIKYLSETKSPRKTFLFISNKENDRRVYSDRIEKLVSENENLNVYEVIGEHITWALIEKNLEEFDVNVKDALWYVSGPNDMVSDISKILGSQRISPDKVFYDEFRPLALDNHHYNPDPKKNSIENIEIFELAVNEFSVHVVITDVEGRIIFANEAAVTTTGYSKEEMLGQTPRLWGGIMTKEFYTKMWNTIKNDMKSFEGDVYNVRKSGEIYIARAHISPIKDLEGKLIGFIATEFEVGEIVRKQQQLEEKISEYERLNRLMVDRELRMVELKKQIDLLENELKSKTNS